jgi:MYXO-CTERM domain-containing protein
VTQRSRLLRTGIVAALSVTSPSLAELTTYPTIGGWEAWQPAAGPFSTVDFLGFPQYMPITTQYEELGVTFAGIQPTPEWPPDPPPPYVLFAPDIFLRDGVGAAAIWSMELTFSTPMRALAIHMPGSVTCKLFSGETVVGVINTGSPPGGLGQFFGLTSTIAFDRVQLYNLPTFPWNPPPAFFVDNIYFSTVPAPGAAAVLMLAGLAGRRRRRCG